MTPKVFISYSWTSQAHQERVTEWADRLLADGVNVILDVYDLKEGQDKYAFMEKMVTDPEVTHVLVISDKVYAQKGDARKKGVGAESQIISKEVYDKVDQEKFIPIVCEFVDNDTPCLPTFLKSRIWIDFSNPEAVNGNWERLVRLLHGKPLHVKPPLGATPAFVKEENILPITPARAKLSTLRQAILQGKPGIPLYRKDFLDACVGHADELRVRKEPEVKRPGDKVLGDFGKLVAVRDLVVDWVLLEAQAAPGEEFSESLIELLEQLCVLKTRLKEVNRWSEWWFEGHRLFVYETFLYIVAALIKAKAYSVLHNVYTSHYILPASDMRGPNQFCRFDEFRAHSETLNAVLTPEGKQFYSPAAELIKRHANRNDLPFADLIQADLLTLLMALITPDLRWYPQLMHYAGYAEVFPLFGRAVQHKHFRSLAVILGIGDANAIREAAKQGSQRLQVGNWHDFFHCDISFSEAMKLEKLDTIA